MKEYVLDVNILFSAIISGKDIYWQIVTKALFYLPDFAMIELQKYERFLLEKTKFSLDDLKEYTVRLFKKLVGRSVYNMSQCYCFVHLILPSKYNGLIVNFLQT
jgi:hypothetical protein